MSCTTTSRSKRADVESVDRQDGSPRVLVVSGRRFVAESLVEALGEVVVGGVVARAVIAGRNIRESVAEFVPTVGIVDLDDLGLPPEVLVHELQNIFALRRVGFFDSFTASSAATAFELSVTVLVSLTSTLSSMVNATFGPDRVSSATTAEGLTREELHRLSSLTAREIDVLRQLVDGRPIRAVGVALDITSHTVSSHKRRIFKKLGVQNGPAAVALAVKAGLVTSSSHRQPA